MKIEELAVEITLLVGNPNAAIAIRDENSVYLWVNDVWEKISGSSRKRTIGKRLDHLDIVPNEEAARFMREDQLTLTQNRLVSINTYYVQNTIPIRFMTVRTHREKYIIEVSFVLGPVIFSEMFKWSSVRLEHAFGEELAARILKGKDS